MGFTLGNFSYCRPPCRGVGTSSLHMTRNQKIAIRPATRKFQPLQGNLRINPYSQGKPWAKLSWPFGPQRTTLNAYRVLTLGTIMQGDSPLKGREITIRLTCCYRPRLYFGWYERKSRRLLSPCILLLPSWQTASIPNRGRRRGRKRIET